MFDSKEYERTKKQYSGIFDFSIQKLKTKFLPLYLETPLIYNKCFFSLKLSEFFERLAEELSLSKKELLNILINPGNNQRINDWIDNLSPTERCMFVTAFKFLENDLLDLFAVHAQNMDDQNQQ